MPIINIDDRVLITVHGTDAQAFLQSLLTVDVIGLKQNEMRPAALLSPQGKVLYAFLMTKIASGFILDVCRDDSEMLVKKLKFYKLRSQVIIDTPIEVEGCIIWNEEIHNENLLIDTRFQLPVFRGYKTEILREFYGDFTGILRGFYADFTRVRHENGVAEPYQDYSYGEVFPHDINLDQTGGISFTKGCYIGQEVASRMHHRNSARTRLMVAKGTGLTKGDEIVSNEKSMGYIASTGEKTALALVRIDRLKEAREAGFSILVDGKMITLDFPNNVNYSS